MEEQAKPVDAEDTLGVLNLSDEELDAQLSSASGESAQAGAEKTGERAEHEGAKGEKTREGDAEREMIPERLKSLVPAQYRSLDEFVKAYHELKTFSDRQANEIGRLRKSAVDQQMSDEAIREAFEDDPVRGYRLLREREQFSEAEAMETVGDYQESVSQAYADLCREIPGFGNPGRPDQLGETARRIIEYGKQTGLIADGEHLARIHYDPVNGPTVLRAIYRQMKAEEELARLKPGMADSVARRINAAAKGPRVMAAGVSAGEAEAGVPVLTDEQIEGLSDEQLEVYLERSRSV